LVRYHPGAVLALLRTAGQDLALVDAVWQPECGRALLASIRRRRRSRGRTGVLAGVPEPGLHELSGPGREIPDPSVLSAEQSNTPLLYGDRPPLKVHRPPDAG